MIKLDLHKGKKSLEFSTRKVTPKRIHQDSTIEFLQGTFKHININPLYDTPPSNNVNQSSSKYPKWTLRIDLNQIMQQKEKYKDTHTIGMTNVPILEDNQQSAPLLLTSSSNMGPPMNTSCGTSTIVASTSIESPTNSLIDISPIPQRNVAHHQVNMMTQGEASNNQTYQVNNHKVMLTSMGHDQHIMQQQQHQVVQGPSGANVQH